MKKTRAVVWGSGVTAKACTRMMLDKGVEVVSVIARNPDIVGKDVAEFAGLDESLNIQVSNDADAVLSQGVDVVMMCLTNGLDTMFPFYERCIRHGANVLTVSGDFVFPWHDDPRAKELDALAKEHQVSLAASGLEDIFAVNIPALVAGGCHRVDEVEVYCESNLGHATPKAVKAAGIGMPLVEFEQLQEENAGFKGQLTAPLDAIADDMGLTRTAAREKIEPILAEADTEAHGLDMVIRKDHVIGYKLMGELDTQEGVPLRWAVGMIFYEPSRPDLSPVEVKIKGEPDMHIVSNNVDVHITTNAQMVNRIPDVIACAPGVITTNKMPRLRYRQSV